MVSITVQVDIDGQYRALREEAGVLTRSRALLRLGGADAAEYLHSQVTNEVESLEPGQGIYAALLDRKGRMQADMRLLRTDTAVLADLEPETVATTSRHLTMYSVGREVKIEDATGSVAVVSVIGPAAAELTGLAPLAREHDHAEVKLDGVEARQVKTDLGLDLVVESDQRDALAEALSARGVVTVDEAAAEIVRVESGRPRYGREMTTETIPQEAGINERAVSFTKGCYIGQETVARLHYKGKPNRHLRGLRLSGLAETGLPVSLGERQLGRVGTAVLSPAHGPIALAILRREASPGEEVEVGESGVSAEVVALPFGDPA